MQIVDKRGSNKGASKQRSLPVVISIVLIACALLVAIPASSWALSDWILIDKTGKRVGRDHWSDPPGTFSEGVTIYYDGDGSSKVMDKQGSARYRIPQGMTVYAFKNGYAVFKQNGKYGYMDSFREIVVKAKFDNAYDFLPNVAVVREGDKRGTINKSGNYVAKPKYDRLYDCAEGLQYYRLGDEQGYLNCNWGDVAFKFDRWINRVGSFSQGAALMGEERNDQMFWGIINKAGKWVVEPAWPLRPGRMDGPGWTRRARSRSSSPRLNSGTRKSSATESLRSG